MANTDTKKYLDLAGVQLLVDEIVDKVSIEDALTPEQINKITNDFTEQVMEKFDSLGSIETSEIRSILTSVWG